MGAKKYTKHTKFCARCGLEKNTRADFYKWRAQCIACYNEIRGEKYAAKSERKVVINSIPLEAR